MDSELRSTQWWRRVLLTSLLLALLIIPSAVLAQGDSSPGLEPGAHVTYEQRVPINLVFVGYDQGDINMNDLKDWLPDGYAPIVRYPAFYGIAGRDMGLQFNFKYNITWAGNGFEDDFFDYLGSIATPGPMTLYQALYNDQVSNVLDVTDPVGYIDAPSTEQWLMNNAHRLGVDTEKGYTVFFINWYDRPDFQFHVYTKTDYLDPDTGVNLGEVRASRKIVAWGGSHGRTWFYDLSAGPEAWTYNWAVDNPDSDGNGVEDYRMPPIWEYTAGGFRDPAALGQDLGLVTRFAAINLLFTSSPLYDPLVSSPGPDGRKVVQVEMFETDAGRREVGTDFLDLDFVQNELSALQPYYDWATAEDLYRRPDLGARRALAIFSDRRDFSDCWEQYGTTFAQMFCHFDANYSDYISGYPEEDYVASVFSYNLTQRRLGSQWGLLGFADDNWVDGTPSYIFVFGAREYRDLGYGFSDTTVHEVGHNIGMSHVHDGYDSELGFDYGPADSTFFAWIGDESDSIMSYLGVTGRFGVFSQDNMNRYQFAGYLNWANEVLAGVAAHPDAGTVQAYVDAADEAAMMAQDAFKDWDYAAAAWNAREAYEQIARAAAELGVSTERVVPLRLITPTGTPPKEGDPIRFPNN